VEPSPRIRAVTGLHAGCSKGGSRTLALYQAGYGFWGGGGGWRNLAGGPADYCPAAARTMGPSLGGRGKWPGLLDVCAAGRWWLAEERDAPNLLPHVAGPGWTLARRRPQDPTPGTNPGRVHRGRGAVEEWTRGGLVVLLGWGAAAGGLSSTCWEPTGAPGVSPAAPV